MDVYKEEICNTEMIDAKCTLVSQPAVLNVSTTVHDNHFNQSPTYL